VADQPQTAPGTFAIPMPRAREALLQTPVDMGEREYWFLEVYLKLMRDAVTGAVNKDREQDTNAAEQVPNGG
jgi:hypothetical protein